MYRGSVLVLKNKERRENSISIMLMLQRMMNQHREDGKKNHQRKNTL